MKSLRVIIEIILVPSDGTDIDADTDILFILVLVFYAADISDIGQNGRYANR
jgi:hypothetical protein